MQGSRRDRFKQVHLPIDFAGFTSSEMHAATNVRGLHSELHCRWAVSHDFATSSPRSGLAHAAGDTVKRDQQQSCTALLVVNVSTQRMLRQ